MVKSRGEQIRALTPLTQACALGNTETARLFLTLNADVDRQINGMAPLHWACVNNDFETANLLLGHGANINQDTSENLFSTSTPLVLTLLYGKTEMVKFLLDVGAQVSEWSPAFVGGREAPGSKTMLMYACEGGNTETVEFLINNHTSGLVSEWVNTNMSAGYTALMFACDKGHTKTVELLLNNHANVNQVTSRGASALMMASENGHLETVILLLERQANVSQAMMNGASPLMAACLGGHVEVARLLIDRGAEVNRATNDNRTYFEARINIGMTALMFACKRRVEGVSLLNLLLDHQANVNQVDSRGDTALMWACWHGHKNAAKLLLDRGADVELRTSTATRR